MSTYTMPKLMLPAIVTFSGLLMLKDQMQLQGTMARYMSANTPHTDSKLKSQLPFLNHAFVSVQTKKTQLTSHRL